MELHYFPLCPPSPSTPPWNLPMLPDSRVDSLFFFIIVTCIRICTHMHMYTHIILTQGFSSWHCQYLVLENFVAAGFSVYVRIFDSILIIYRPYASGTPLTNKNVFRHYIMMPGDTSHQAAYPTHPYWEPFSNLGYLFSSIQGQIDLRQREILALTQVHRCFQNIQNIQAQCDS